MEDIPRSRTADPKCLHQFLLVWVKHESYSCSTSLPLLCKVGLKILSQSSGYSVVSHFGLNLHFPNGVRNSFICLFPIGYLLLLNACLSFLPIVFFLLIYRNSLYILDVSPVWSMYCNYLLLLQGFCLFILLMVSSDKQTLLF